MCSTWNDIVKHFITRQDWRKHSALVILLWCNQNNIFSKISKISVRYFFLFKPFKFWYFLLNLFNHTRIAVVLFRSFISVFSLHFSSFLRQIFCPGKFREMSIVAKFFIMYSNSFFSCRTISQLLMLILKSYHVLQELRQPL